MRTTTETPLGTDSSSDRRSVYRLRLLLILGLLVVVTIVMAFVPPISQDQSYHLFADRRSILGVPNGLDVLSNLPFLFVGLLGLYRLSLTEKIRFSERSERWAYAIFLVGVTLTCFGSAYYHLAPDDARLVWDRLPMSMAFMALFAGVISERVNLRLGVWLVAPLVILGIFSVWYWYASEMRGEGDLRVYVGVQFFPMLAVPLLVLAMPSVYTLGGYFFVALGLYGLAKVFELLDSMIFSIGGLVSGHTLKHLTAAAAIFVLVSMLSHRQIDSGKQENSGGEERQP